MEEIIKNLIYIHAFFGGVGLIAGIGSLIVTKGSAIHKKFGKLFSIGMIISSLISIPISWMPNHENLFLFLIGLFTIYLVLAGNRALTFKTKEKADWIDKTISGSTLAFSLIMIALGGYKLTVDYSSGTLFMFFGGFGLFFAITDFRFYKNPRKDRTAYLVSHIRKIVGAFIASVTAFLVAGLGFMNLVFWILPTILGTFYIIYWRRKVQGKMATNIPYK